MFQIKRKWIFVRCALSFSLFVSILAACGGGGGGGGGGSVVGSSTPTPSNPVVVPSVAATISVQPVSQSVYSSQTASFSVVAAGEPAANFQWQRNGVNIPGAVSATYVSPVLGLGDNGSVYSVVVSNPLAQVTSTAASLRVANAAPSIVTDPSSQTVTAPQPAVFTVTPAGLPPFTYQWQKNGGNIVGANTSSYTTPENFASNHGDQFTVVIGNSQGSITSKPARLGVLVNQVNYLLISEVSSCYYSNTACWFELYNPTPNAINLNAYSFKSTALDISKSGSTLVNAQTFTLPSFNLAPGVYVVVNSYPLTSTVPIFASTQKIVIPPVSVSSAKYAPYWFSSGYIELLSNNATVDFVRFGASTQLPTTASAWSGVAAPSLPSGQYEYGKSLVRPYGSIDINDTNSATGWVLVDWSTPAGRNDVPAGAVDTDNDGIPDSAEVAGGTFAGMDLYAMGARTGQRDIFVEVDYMDSTDIGIIPRAESLQKVVDAFAAKNFSLHFDAGNLFTSSFSISNFNLGQGNSKVPYEKCVSLDLSVCISNLTNKRTLYDWKNVHFDVRRASIFHYAMFANSLLDSGSNTGPSGVGELYGNDFSIAHGGRAFYSLVAGSTGLNLLINRQSASLMHELGHNLGLSHGGNETTNYKPNYLSVMNYLYSSNFGLPASPSASTAYLRWRYALGDGKSNLAGTSVDACDLPNSPCGPPSQFIIDYSDGSGNPMNEMALSELGNIGRGSAIGAYADWNLSGNLTTTTYAKDLNADGSYTLMNDHNDWANLILPFSRYSQGTLRSKSTKNQTYSMPPLVDPMSNDRQAAATEEMPTARELSERQYVRP